MNRAQFLTLFAEMLEVPAGSLTGAEMLSELEQWDSVAVIGFIALADEHYQKQLSQAELASAKSVEDLARMVGAAS